jgi:hypothetical protein
MAVPMADLDLRHSRPQGKKRDRTPGEAGAKTPSLMGAIPYRIAVTLADNNTRTPKGVS